MSPWLFWGITLFAVIVAPILMTRYWGLIDFSSTGQIGDTIGGLTAPVIGLASAFLIYKAFQAQIQANNLIMSDRLFETTVESVLRFQKLLQKKIYFEERKAIEGNKFSVEKYNIEIYKVMERFDINDLDKNLDTENYHLGEVLKDSIILVDLIIDFVQNQSIRDYQKKYIGYLFARSDENTRLFIESFQMIYENFGYEFTAEEKEFIKDHSYNFDLDYILNQDKYKKSITLLLIHWQKFIMQIEDLELSLGTEIKVTV